MTTTRRLSAAFVRSVTRPGRYGDGRGGFGLFLRVHRTSTGGRTKSWCQRIVPPGGRPTHLGLGSYPIITLAEARETALANRRAIARGEDPRRDSTVPTFDEAAAKVITSRARQWKGGKDSQLAGQWRSSIRTYASPHLGSMSVGDITGRDVLRVVGPIWSDRPAIARRVLGRVRVVLEWARATGYIRDNPATGIESALPRQNGRTAHHKALDPGDVPDALRRIRACGAPLPARLATEFLILSGARSGEVRGMKWSEVYLDEWRIPAGRMKAGRPHVVPLADAAIAVLDRARRELPGGARGRVFPAPRSGGVMAASTLLACLRRAKVPATVHGFRASLRSWAAEKGVAAEVAETLLAHVPASLTQSYQRADLLDERRRVLDAWGGHCTTAGADGKR